MTAAQGTGVELTGARYDLALESRVADGGDEYRFRTADGVCSKRSFRPPELLLADVLWDAGVDSLLVPEANYGVVGVLLAARCERVAMTASSARAARLCEANAAANCVDADVSLMAGIDVLSREVDGGDGEAGGDVTRRFDAVAFAPKPYAPIDVTAQRLVDAASRLDPGGRVYLAASERTGLNRYEPVLEDVAERVDCVAERGDCRVLEARIGTGGVDDVSEYVASRAFEATVDGVSLSLVSLPGVFSATGLDDGTRLLAETATVGDGDRVLDLCCGYGALGAYAASVADCDLVLSDDDRVATACAERTLDATGVDGTVVTADGVSGVAGECFDRILCNPPTHATDHVLADLFDGARDVLARDGTLFAVYHRDLDLRPQLAAFAEVEGVATGGEHVVVRAN